VRRTGGQKHAAATNNVAAAAAAVGDVDGHVHDGERPAPSTGPGSVGGGGVVVLAARGGVEWHTRGGGGIARWVRPTQQRPRGRSVERRARRGRRVVEGMEASVWLLLLVLLLLLLLLLLIS
jgi:hypothetical protein